MYRDLSQSQKEARMEKAWISWINEGNPTLWVTVTISPSMFFTDQFIDKYPSSTLLKSFQHAGITIPEGRDDMERLNNILRTDTTLLSKFHYVSLPKAADRLVKNSANLSEEERMKLNRYILESAFSDCPPILTQKYYVSRELLERRFSHVFRRINTGSKIFFKSFIYTFNFYELNEGEDTYHIHCFIQHIDRSLAPDLQVHLNRFLGNSDCCPHYEHGVIFPESFPKYIFNLDIIFSKLIDKGWLTLVDYQGKTGYALNKDPEKNRAELKELFKFDTKDIYRSLRRTKDGARYIAKKKPTHNLGFRPFMISGRDIHKASGIDQQVLTASNVLSAAS